MKILVLGAAGMIGARMVRRLLADGTLAGRPIAGLMCFDIVAPDHSHERIPVENVTGDVADFAMCRDLVAERPDVIFHLAAIVSGQAEAEFELGYRINLDGTRHLLEAVRLQGDGYRPRLVYASSIAVFGAPFPDGPIPDEYHLTPRTSYGTQKAIGELLLSDYTRRGFVDGVGLRFPTIVVRPGKPNAAASGFFSGIIREPLAGQRSNLPVGRDVKHWFASPDAAVGFCLHAAGLDGERIGTDRNLTLPGVAVTTGEELEALARVAGDDAVALVSEDPDDAIRAIVGEWPSEFEAKRAEALGFRAERDFETIVRSYARDERIALDA